MSPNMGWFEVKHHPKRWVLKHIAFWLRKGFRDVESRGHVQSLFGWFQLLKWICCLAMGGCLTDQCHVSTGECRKSYQPHWQTRHAVWRESKPCILAAIKVASLQVGTCFTSANFMECLCLDFWGPPLNCWLLVGGERTQSIVLQFNYTVIHFLPWLWLCLTLAFLRTFFEVTACMGHCWRVFLLTKFCSVVPLWPEMERRRVVLLELMSRSCCPSSAVDHLLETSFVWRIGSLNYKPKCCPKQNTNTYPDQVL